jgi:hypothetical protein
LGHLWKGAAPHHRVNTIIGEQHKKDVTHVTHCGIMGSNAGWDLCRDDLGQTGGRLGHVLGQPSEIPKCGVDWLDKAGAGRGITLMVKNLLEEAEQASA